MSNQLALSSLFSALALASLCLAAANGSFDRHTSGAIAQAEHTPGPNANYILNVS